MTEFKVVEVSFLNEQESVIEVIMIDDCKNKFRGLLRLEDE